MCNGNELHCQSNGNGNDYISKKCVMVMDLGLGKNTGTPVYRGISLAWYVPRHTCPYRGTLVFLFLVTETLKSPKY